MITDSQHTTAYPSLTGPNTLNPENWITADQTRLLYRILPVIGSGTAIAALWLLYQVLQPPLHWQEFVLLLALVCGIGLYASAYYLNRQGRPRRSASLILIALALLSVTIALFFQDMLAIFVMLSIINMLLATTLISPRLGGAYAITSALCGVLCYAVQEFGLGVTLPQYEIPQFVRFAGELLSTWALLGFGVATLTASQASLRRALKQMAGLSHTLAETNTRLEHQIAEAQHAEAQRLALALEQERMGILTSFVADAAHEFRNPLAVINTQLYVLRRQAREASMLQRLGTVQEQTDYINTLVESMLTMARLDGGVPPEEAPLDLGEVIREVTDGLHVMLQATHQQVVLDLPPLPIMRGDRDRLRLVFYHLLRNACEYSSPGGTITLRASQTNGSVYVRVTDQGIGMTAEQVERIFERFYRGDPARTTRGAGLGLSITKAIIGAHGGDITVKSAPGEGSTFTILLPVAAA
ncbi:MAG: HAMP domain-containing histidine kinase [Anaerolineae bacterium]|nr:HAMP domain-containing histidine kinase [Anaerolineae bacterium]